MDLHSGLPYWIIKNPLFDYYNPLKKDLETDIVIIGFRYNRRPYGSRIVPDGTGMLRCG